MGSNAFKSQAQGWKTLLNFTDRSHWAVFVPALLLCLPCGILQPALALFLGRIFDSFSDFGAGIISGPALMDKITTYALYLCALGAATCILKGGHFTLFLVFGELQAKAVRDALFQSLLEKDMEWYETRSTGVGSLLSRLQTQIRELQIGTSQPFGLSLVYIVQAIAALGLAFYTSWKLTLVIIAAMPVAGIVLSYISSIMAPNIVAQEAGLVKASALATNAILAIDTVKCFNGQELEIGQYITALKRAARFYVKQALSNALQIGFTRFITTSMFVQGFWYGSELVASGKFSSGDVLTTFWACLIATKAIEDILPHMIVLEKGRAASISLKAILDQMDRGRKLAQFSGRITPMFCEGDIEVRNVSFAYPSRPTNLVLKKSTFFFPAGETTFLVGKSGSGKSTLGNLLMRFYQPRTGDIFIDGISINDLDLNWLRNNITLVQQQSILFNETIFRNISFGQREYQKVTRSQVKICIDFAALQTTLSEMPKGLETIVGSGGSSLSGGQKQRLALARARLRNTPVLVLDESTSSLDYISRTTVMKAIREWRRGKTTIIITHDMSQVQEDDFVYVLADGRIKEEGYKANLAAREDGPFSLSLVPQPIVAPMVNFDFGLDDPFLRSARIRTDGPDYQGTTRRLNRAVSGSNLTRPRQNERSHLSLGPTGDINMTRIPEKPVGLLRNPSVAFRSIPRRQPIASDDAILDIIDDYASGFSDLSPQVMRPIPRFSMYGSAPQTNELYLSRRATVEKTNITRRGRPRAYEMTAVVEKDTVNIGKGRHNQAASELPQLMRRVSNAFSTTKDAVEDSGLGEEKPISILRILMTVWPTLDKKKRYLLVLGFVSTLLHAASPPAFSYVLAQLLGTFFLKEDRARLALTYSMAILGLAIGDGFASFFMHYNLEICGEEWVDALRVSALTRILDQPKSWFEKDENEVSQLTSTLDRNAEEMRNIVGRFAPFIVLVGVMMALAITWSLIVCWKVTLVALAAAPGIYLITKGFEMVSNRWESRTNHAGNTAGSIFAETFTDVRTVRALTLESYFHKKYNHATSNALVVGIQRALYCGFFFGASDSAISFLTALIFWYGATVARSLDFTVKDILTVFSMLLFSTANANAVFAYIPQIASSADTATRLLRLANLPQKKSFEHSGTLKLNPHDPATLNGPINFINLTFTYPSRPEKPALAGFNLTIPGGLCTALVGSSGSGKSTVASLLLGFYPPDSRPTDHTCSDTSTNSVSITLSGRDIRTLHTPTLRSLIAIVPQFPTIFNTTVRKNIVYGLDLMSAMTTMQAVEEAATKAGVHDFLLTLPEGYDTLIGEGGLGLSGGQAQRIVIARALCRRPRILVLDEATSALDGESSRIIRDSVMNLLRESKRDKAWKLTVIIITHAKQMMEISDNVVVLHQGKVVEEGEYQQLVNKVGGKLWEMLKIGGALR